MENNSSGGFMLPFITGILAGAAIGLLFAPDKGSETRKKVMNTLSNLSDSFSEMTGGETETSDASSSSTGSSSYQSSGESYSDRSSSRRSGQSY